MAEPIRVLVVDDSPFVCRLLTSFLQSVPDIKVAGTALNGHKAIELAQALKPSVMTLDLEMPGMNGLETLTHIMYECPTPAIVIAGGNREGAATTLQALEIGAIDFVLKYLPGANTDPELLKKEIIGKVRAAAQVRVIRSIRERNFKASSEFQPSKESVPAPQLRLPTGSLARSSPTYRKFTPLPKSVVVIGASTGGPIALRELLEKLPTDFPAAVIVVQHMLSMFTKVLAAQLNQRVPMDVREAQDGEVLESGTVFIAPGGYHLRLTADSKIKLDQGPEINGHRPSVDVTMESVAALYGSRAKGVILTGMGSDGCRGLKAIFERGGNTFAQDAQSCVVNGMPQSAIDAGAVERVGPPVQIAEGLLQSYAGEPAKT
ncbi:MAG: chemotaxis response regulator protein-glutamate methylesterase [Blastocatellia bacterium]|nr:chemotaxis response regulator protein-glutamate methylesterase [Blastocatellia bacterium]